jgi:hypothetical protein
LVVLLLTDLVDFMRTSLLFTPLMCQR